MNSDRISFFLIVATLVRCTRSGIPCACTNVTSDLIAVSGRFTAVKCCDSDLVNSEIIWYKNGVPNPWQGSEFRIRENSIFVHFVQHQDSGLYTCRRKTEEGRECTLRSVNLIVRAFEVEKPKVTCSPDVFTLNNQTSTLWCETDIGASTLNVLEGTVTWYRLTGGTWRAASKIQGITTQEICHPRSGKCRSNVSIVATSSGQFGTYACVVNNISGQSHCNVTLNYGVSAEEKKMKRFKSLALYISLFVLFSVLLIVAMSRNILIFRIILKRRKTEEKKGVPYRHDVFVISSSDSEDFVRRKLLMRLEKELQLNCYCPQREMMGGEDMFISLHSMLSDSRSVVVVLSEGLTSDLWALHCIDIGLKLALESRVTMVAIALKSMKKSIKLEELKQKLNVVKILAYPTKVRYSSSDKKFLLNFSEIEKSKATTLETDVKVHQPVEQSPFLKFITKNEVSLSFFLSFLFSCNTEKRFWLKLLLYLPSDPISTQNESREPKLTQNETKEPLPNQK